VEKVDASGRNALVVTGRLLSTFGNDSQGHTQLQGGHRRSPGILVYQKSQANPEAQEGPQIFNAKGSKFVEALALLPHAW
jgi:hypothetical protein